MSDAASDDLGRQILETFGLPADARFVRFITAPPARQMAEQRYREALPGRMAAVAADFGEGLPEGMRFEWDPE